MPSKPYPPYPYPHLWKGRQASLCRVATNVALTWVIEWLLAWPLAILSSESWPTQGQAAWQERVRIGTWSQGIHTTQRYLISHQYINGFYRDRWAVNTQILRKMCKRSRQKAFVLVSDLRILKFSTSIYSPWVTSSVSLSSVQLDRLSPF